jgi:hypothetical protein
MTMKALRTGFAVLALALALAATAPYAHAARPPLAVGVADQSPTTFSDPNFQSLGVRYSRYITAWNTVLVNPDALDAWIGAARAAGVEPMIAFNHSDGDQCPASPCRLPSVRQYRAAFSEFRRRYPDLRTIQPWNEANHQSQPTAKKPRRAAEFYNAVRSLCRGCRVVAADLLDATNMERWLGEFQRYAKKPRLWGLHNYTDTNRFKTSGTERLLRTVPGEVWLTETGGVFEFRTVDGRVPLRASEDRAARSIRHMFRIAATYGSRIKRLYVYQWRKTNAEDRFDAGLVAPDGQPRRSLDVLRQLLGGGAKPLKGKKTPQPPKKNGQPGGDKRGGGRK